MAEREQIVICKLGRSAYAPTWDLQKQLQRCLIEAKRTEPRTRIPHVMLLVEHPHVYTLGKSGDRANLLTSEADLERTGAKFIHIDRGGDITYHGPGQLVVYPILDMDFFYHDIHRFLRDLEEVVIRTCAEYGVVGSRIDGRTGVWIQAPAQATAPARKICAMGIRFSRWVSMHGIGFNVATDLSRYEHIVPCGISDGDITSLERESGLSITLEDVSNRLLSNFSAIFDADLSILDGNEADTFLRTYLAPHALPAL